ncbi:hypothetical protein Lal_00039261 [Lupinus albus]|nr:hypothetical protein Lal_00039261 [Lupinus albus]
MESGKQLAIIVASDSRDIQVKEQNTCTITLKVSLSAPRNVGTIGRPPLPNSLFLLFYLLYALYLIVCDQHCATIASAAPTIGIRSHW